ncbi:SufE family protein [Cytophaga hutchinsonii]|uniref:Cysteine desulfuration protein SufE n=1 Tax=Cytophaga hutchinsonii (strain ATCC 33406 / DSM 1761 / CIP 103989 / NBRC 15051 / NCIMB 9469 / D465) TaxID=269798 RepID=A0A6N4SPQ6_CYTH3|nr:SufE family protein [Cytophaga hutchinsonii]ABG58251.1 Cysteine desulfuration protein SufE [Cytophaga hutchinsonii ATCC 33406]SFX54032.1 Cysteine desulfuration protein SufE [Cytophaga hutchinsonii ATCC 33406]
MATINEIQDQIIEDFGLFDEWDEKYAYIIDLGKKLPGIDPKYKVEENIIKGCQSLVWMTSNYKDGKVNYEGESDAIIVKGLVALLLKVLSGQPAEDIAKSDMYFIHKIGMEQHLSMTRSNGLASMVKQMKMHAIAYQSKTV